MSMSEIGSLMMPLPRSTILAFTVNDLLLRYPSMLPVLNDFGIDSCCGGAKPLGEVIGTHRLDPELVVRELAAATPELA